MTADFGPLFAEPVRPTWRTDPAGAAIQYLEENRGLYPLFRRLADDWRARNPNQRFSADMVLHHIRFTTSHHDNDHAFKANNNVTPLLARLYLLDRPGALMDTRESHLDSLHSGVWGRLLALARGES